MIRSQLGEAGHLLEPAGVIPAAAPEREGEPGWARQRGAHCQLNCRLALVADGTAQLFGHDAGQVVGRQVLRAEHRNTADAGPGAVQQQAGRRRGDVGDGHQRGRTVRGDGVGEDAVLADRVGLLQQVLEEGGACRRRRLCLF
jgi:hypothetical protein